MDLSTVVLPELDSKAWRGKFLEFAPLAMMSTHKNFINSILLSFAILTVVTIAICFVYIKITNATVNWIAVQSSTNRNNTASIYGQEFTVATSTFVDGILFQNHADNSLVQIVKNELEGNTVGGVEHDLRYPNLETPLNETYYFYCDATSTARYSSFGSLCVPAISPLLDPGVYTLIYSYPEVATITAYIVQSDIYNDGDHYTGGDFCTWTWNYDGLGNDRAECNYAGTWGFGNNQDMVFAVVQDTELPNYDFYELDLPETSTGTPFADYIPVFPDVHYCCYDCNETCKIPLDYDPYYYDDWVILYPYGMSQGNIVDYAVCDQEEGGRVWLEPFQRTSASEDEYAYYFFNNQKFFEKTTVKWWASTTLQIMGIFPWAEEPVVFPHSEANVQLRDWGAFNFLKKLFPISIYIQIDDAIQLIYQTPATPIEVTLSDFDPNGYLSDNVILNKTLIEDTPLFTDRIYPAMEFAVNLVFFMIVIGMMYKIKS